MDNWERFLWTPLKVVSSYWEYLLKVIEGLAYFFFILISCIVSLRARVYADIG